MNRYEFYALLEANYREPIATVSKLRRKINPKPIPGQSPAPTPMMQSSAVQRAAFKEAVNPTAQGYSRGQPIKQAAMDTYNKNRLITKGNLKGSSEAMPMMAQKAVKTGKI
jgi:hypothetical protein